MANSKDRRHRHSKRNCLLVGLLLVPLLLALGLWQLQRAEQKQQLLDRLATGAPLSSLPNTHHTSSDLLDQLPLAVKLDARLDTQAALLLDNRIRDGKVGYEILLPFEAQSDGTVGIVNLGWIEAPLQRQQLPDVAALLRPLEARTLVLDAMLVRPDSGTALVLGDDKWAQGWPKRIQQPDLPRLEALLQTDLYPALLRLTVPVIDTDTRWTASVMPPSKHLGYAVQWFGLALALIGCLWWFGWGSSASERTQRPERYSSVRGSSARLATKKSPIDSRQG